jgi:hypothetical protein
MNKLYRALLNSYKCRCKFWATCDAKHCFHYEPHTAHSDLLCIDGNPVKYCTRARGFVYDIPYTDGAYDEDECDPNLAFKARRDAEARAKSRTGYPDTVYESVMKKHGLRYIGQPPEEGDL